MQKRTKIIIDIALVTVAVVILAVLLKAPEETTKPVPRDAIHEKFYPMVAKEGKKAAEKFCEDCHNPQQVPLPEGHPPKFRCLFCHKVKPLAEEG